MSVYMEILANQRPFAYGQDENNRFLFSCNFVATSQGVIDALEEEIVSLIEAAGQGARNVDIFVGRASQIPKAGDGPYTLFVDQGGSRPDETHDGSIYERLAFQIVVCATSYTAGRTRALAIWRALHGQRNVEVTA